MNVLRQLIKEFWLPSLVAIVWTAYNFKAISPTQLRFIDVVNIFGPTFFLSSWLIAQIFRVRNQQHVRSGLTTIESRLAELDKAIGERIVIERQALEIARKKQHSEGAPKFLACRYGYLSPRLFRDSNEAQVPLFVDLCNFGRTVHDVSFEIVGGTLQVVQGTYKHDYVFEIPVWATEQSYRVGWTCPKPTNPSPAELRISYTDVFGGRGGCILVIEPTNERDVDGYPRLVVTERYESGVMHHHSGEPDYGYNYSASELRSELLHDLAQCSKNETLKPERQGIMSSGR